MYSGLRRLLAILWSVRARFVEFFLLWFVVWFILMLVWMLGVHVAHADPFDNPMRGDYSPYATGQAHTSRAGRSLSVLPGARVVLSSYYGGGERLAKRTASGAVFRPMGLSAAHRTLPLGTKIELSYGDRSVIAVVNDRGPAAWTGRSLDVSRGVAAQLGFLARGTANLRMRVLAQQ